MNSPIILALDCLAAAASDAGLVRENNEDAAYSGRWRYAVVDGMGGRAAGEVASAAVIESPRHHDTEIEPDALLATLSRAVTEANAEVARAAAEDTARRGMGTTLTDMLWSGSQFALARRAWRPSHYRHDGRSSSGGKPHGQGGAGYPLQKARQHPY